MNEPHVKSLTYKVVTAADVDYDKASSIEIDTPDFSVVASPSEAIFYMKTHFSKENDAREVVEEFICAWDVVIGLDIAPGDLKLSFNHADIIDLSPDKDSNVLNVHLVEQAQATDHIKLHVSRAELPKPIDGFVVSPILETMYNRYRNHIEGRESLLSMAYLCLTIIEGSSGSRKNAAEEYNISKKVLDKLGGFVSERGGPEEARKMPKSGTYAPLSHKEKEWIIKAVKLIIKRVGECGGVPANELPQISLGSLPPIQA
jgi:hypothetical protein